MSKGSKRGRDRFERWKPLLSAVSHLLAWIPRGIAEAGMNLFRHAPGTLGIALRYVLLKRLARSCGDVVAVYPGVYILNPQELSVGSRVSIHPMCYLECVGGLHIGSDVSIAHATSILTHEHDYAHDGLAPTRDMPLILKPVRIQDDVWLGAGVRVLAGVTIATGGVVGANAVVTRDVGERTVVVGVPARPLRGGPSQHTSSAQQIALQTVAR
jgi:acetyltransferase-like isoleucine patch superfamily enzyme